MGEIRRGETVAGLMLAVIIGLFNGLFPFVGGFILVSGTELPAANENNHQLQTRLTAAEAEIQAVTREIETMRQQLEDLQAENLHLKLKNLLLSAPATAREYGDRNSNRVAITFDDGGKASQVRQVLDCLRQAGIKATFFPTGRWIDAEPEIWKQAVAEGHELGNHTYNHRYVSHLTSGGLNRELALWQEAVERALGTPYETVYFRPPGMAGFTGTRGRFYQQQLLKAGLLPVLWDVETVYAFRDRSADPEEVARHVINAAQGGSIILLHFSDHDINALPMIIAGLQAKGLNPGSLMELLLDG